MITYVRACGWLALGMFMGLVLLIPAGVDAAEPAGRVIRVAVTTPDLGSLVQEVGGDRVSVTVFAKGTENPHFVEVRPNFVKVLSRADLFALNGLELESGWAPGILRNARNAAVLLGGRGYLDASTAVRPLEVPATEVNRSMGDVHPFGNPHFFLDPMAGLRVARLIRDKLRELSPADHPYFQRRFDDFQQRLVSALVGPDLAARFHADKLARLIELDGLDPFLAERGERGDLGGWLGDARAMQGVAVVADHNIWPYFAHRFGLEVIGFLEPKPGVAPTTRHLAQLLNEMKARSVRLILATPYYDPRHAAFLAEKSGARVLPMANQVGARPEAANYLALIDYNVRQLREGCREPAK